MGGVEPHRPCLRIDPPSRRRYATHGPSPPPVSGRAPSPSRTPLRSALGGRAVVRPRAAIPAGRASVHPLVASPTAATTPAVGSRPGGRRTPRRRQLSPTNSRDVRRNRTGCGSDRGDQRHGPVRGPSLGSAGRAVSRGPAGSFAPSWRQAAAPGEQARQPAAATRWRNGGRPGGRVAEGGRAPPQRPGPPPSPRSCWRRMVDQRATRSAPHRSVSRRKSASPNSAIQ